MPDEELLENTKITVPVRENLKNGSSKAMNVNGSVVPAVFSYSPGNGVTVAIRRLICLLDDPGSSSFNKFGNLSALSNGLLVSAVIDGQTYDLTTIKDNADLITRSDRSHFGNSASDTLGGAVGFGDSYDAFVGTVDFSEDPLILSGSDSIQVTVRDNLSGISTLEIVASMGKKLIL